MDDSIGYSDSVEGVYEDNGYSTVVLHKGLSKTMLEQEIIYLQKLYLCKTHITRF